MRLLTLIPVLWGVSLLVFIAMNFVPGDPASIVLGINATPELVETFRERYGLNLPIYERYLNWLVGMLHGDFGKAYISGLDIGPALLERLPVTLELSLLAITIAT